MSAGMTSDTAWGQWLDHPSRVIGRTAYSSAHRKYHMHSVNDPRDSGFQFRNEAGHHLRNSEAFQPADKLLLSGTPNLKKAPDLKPENIVPGEKDQAGRTIADVYWITKEYAVYRWRKCTDEKTFFGLRHQKSPSYGITAHFGSDKKQQERYALIGPNLARVCALQKGSLSAKDPINCELARCITMALQGYEKDARNMLVSLEDRLQSIRTSEDRSFYALLLTLMVAFTIASMMILRWHGLINSPSLFPQMTLVIMFGALGGYFSVLSKINKLFVDPEASRMIIGISAASRILVSITGAFAVYTFMLSTFGRSIVNAEMVNEAGFATICIFAFLAGFSENFVPSIFRALEQRSNQQDEYSDTSLPSDGKLRPTRRRTREV
jgi:hypothetical protein